MKPSLNVTLVIAAIVGDAAHAHAHDYWMVPSELVVLGDRDVALSLFVGEDCR